MTYIHIKGIYKRVVKGCFENKHCRQFELLPVFVEKVEVYGKTISSHNFQDIGMQFFCIQLTTKLSI